jgi:hypothetical protein
VLVMRDGIVGTLANWMRRRRRGTLSQISEEADRQAHDQQQDWQPEGAPKGGGEVV